MTHWYEIAKYRSGDCIHYIREDLKFYSVSYQLWAEKNLNKS